ncbi:MAG: UDP-glucose/GDP-mannose dehydrogenase family protein [Rhizobiaceae bacterium]|nr:UDP-glucose/GDP-mannose dehydrogenase family protein [Rhizobiaceae bacterium]
MRVAVIGSGYVGLVSGACLAEIGHQVVCVDKNPQQIDSLCRGVIPIFEEGLEQLVSRNTAAGRLEFSTELPPAVRQADVVMIAVGTPSRRGDGHADLSFVYAAARDVAAALEGFTAIVTKSTVPVGTSDEMERIVSEANPKAQFAAISNPEFLREGAAIADFMRPDRIVIGVEDERARAVMHRLYAPLGLRDEQILFTHRRAAELIKYAANAFLAMKITFANELADLCEAVGADVNEVTLGIGKDARIGEKFLRPGPGYGGSCFPKDTMALMRTAQENQIALRLVETTVSANDSRKAAMSRRIMAACGGRVRGKTIALLGLTFKPNTDDMREAPSLWIIRGLQDLGARIRAYDPEGMDAARKEVTNVHFAKSAHEACIGADALVLVTEWPEFAALNFSEIALGMNALVCVDLRNQLERETMEAQGFSYHAVGRGNTPAHGLDAPPSSQPGAN